MADEKQKRLLDIYEELPQEVREAIFSVNTADTIMKIGRENKLTTEKIGILADEAGLLMLGVTHPNNFISNLDKRLQIDKETTRKVAHAVNEQIFAKIRESLRMIHNQVPISSPGKNQTPQVMPQMIKPQGYVSNKEEIKPPIPVSKDIIAERSKKEIFRSKPEIVEKPLPPLPKSKYPDSADPYREPTG